MIGESMAWWGGGGYWPKYVPVAKRIAKAKKAAEKLRKKGIDVQPVELSGRKIAVSFWGKGWCDHMDSFHDYENRLPRGRSYVRNGSVVHLDVSKGKISALVAGTEVYKVKIGVEPLSKAGWEWIKNQCAGQISSLIDLLKGKLSDGVMRVVANRDNGLFPGPKEIKMCCSCPDSAGMCKHIAAVFYGVGARLDSQPELLFLLRGVDHAELAASGDVDAVIGKNQNVEGGLGGADLAEMFGIEFVGAEAVQPPIPTPAGKDRKIPRVPAAKPQPKKQKSTGRKKSIAKTEADVSDVSHPVSEAETPPKTRQKAQKGTAAVQKDAAPKAKPRSTASKTAKPKAGRAMPRQSAAAKSEAKRLESLERLVDEYVAAKKGQK